MDFLDFIPIENRGMSVLTALTFFFAGVGLGFMWSVMKREFKRINKELEKHETKLDERCQDIAEMKTDIALTRQSIQNIEEMMKMMRVGYGK